MGRVQNGVLYLRYRRDFVITKAECCRAFTHKIPLLFYCRNCSQASASTSQSPLIVFKNIHFAILLSFLLFITYNSKTIRHTRMFYIQNGWYYQRSFSGLELHAGYDWQARAPNTHHGLLPLYHFVRISTTLKNHGMPAALLHTKSLLYYRGCFVSC